MSRNLITRFKDRNGDRIWIGDVVLVQEYPDKYVGGSLDYEGVVEEREGTIVATYYDIGEEEWTPLSHFPVKGRLILNEEERREYWRIKMLGGEPPERFYKRELYHENEVYEYADE